MDTVFVIRNQLGQYWGKKKRWVDGTRPRKVGVYQHRDEALNQLVELSARDIELRGEAVPAELDARRIPLVEPSEHRLPDEEDLTSEEPAEAEDTPPEPPE